jgi:hypothetical protein
VFKLLLQAVIAAAGSEFADKDRDKLSDKELADLELSEEASEFADHVAQHFAMLFTCGRVVLPSPVAR